MKRILVLLTLIMLVTGCSNAAGKKKNAEFLLENKYGRDIAIRDYDGAQLGERWYSVRAYAEEEPDIIFKADIDSDMIVDDTYVQRKVGCAMRDRVKNVLNDLTGGFVVYASPTTYYTVSKDPEITPERFDEENSSNEYIIILYFDKEMYSSEQAYDAAKKAIEGIGNFSGYVQVTMTDNDKLSKIYKYFTEQDDIYSELNDMLINDKTADVRYDNGVVGTTYDEFVDELN